jgi:hypothetical protein
VLSRPLGGTAAHYPFGVPRTSSALLGRPRTGRVVALVAGASLILATWAGASSAAVAKSKSTTTTTAKSKSHKSTTTTTAAATTTTAAVSAADTWLIRAIGAEQKIGSVHITGDINQKPTKIKLSLTVNGDGEGGGTIVQDGSTIQLKLAGTLIYFKAPTKFWNGRSTKAEAKAYGGKWIEVSALNTEFESFDQFFNAADLVQALFQGHTTPLTLSKPTTLDGHKVVIVSDTVVAKGKRSTGHLWIADTGKPIVYKIEDSTPTEAATTITFSHYGKAVSITIPPEPINAT